MAIAITVTIDATKGIFMLLLFKLIIVALLLYMIFNLFRALFVMLSNDPEKPPMSRYLGRRVGIAAIVLLLMVIAAYAGFLPFHPRPY
jgi:Na+/H+ antiporter NhaD/arsenite permease-like protein|tara:strand:- start:108 stop:371 length:264 start_codon:yes stop_codon:yes gene_type:complete